MGDKTKIEWSDATWNPVTGCSKASPGCDNCYAESIAHRFAGSKAYPNGFDVTLRPERLDQPLRWRRPRRVFVNSMSDLFHDQIPTEYIAKVFAVMALAPQHTFQILTKRHARMRALLNDLGFRARIDHTEYAAANDDIDSIPAQYAYAAREARRLPDGSIPSRWPLPNVWLGVSVEDQKWADVRVPALLNTPAAVRFLSCEPLLGPVDLAAWLPYAACVQWEGQPTDASCAALQEVVNAVGRLHGLGWVIVGGESGPHARPMHPDWARSLRDQCDTAGIPFLFKQWGQYVPLGQMPEATFADWDAQHGNDAYHENTQWRVGKKRAGRELDGRTWDEHPEAVT